jgi:hypothetical protein
MKKYDTISELKSAPKVIYEDVMTGVDEDDIGFDGELLSRFADETGPGRFSSYFGGAIYLAESIEDLKLIPSTIECFDREHESLGGFYSIFEAAGSYDICEFIKGGEYVRVLLICTNDGGDMYFIPKEFVTENVLISISLSN